MLNKLRQRTRDEKGFTLIELLVVILIIGILAAIAIPSFLGQRDKANDATAKTQVKSAQTALESWFTDNQTYAGATQAELKKIEPTLADATFNAEPTVGPAIYTVTMKAQKTNNLFSIERKSDGTTVRNCTPSDTSKRGGCPATGSW